MEKIIKFCENAESIFCNTVKVESLLDKTLHIDKTATAIYRTRYSVDGSCIFTMELGTIHEHDILLEIERAKVINLFYPNLFSFRYNGRHVEVIANIPMIKKYVGAVNRFGSSFNFISLLRKRLNHILRLKNLLDNDLMLTVDPNILSTGSINFDTNAFCVDLDINQSNMLLELSDAITGKCETADIAQLNMKFWAREINPDINKSDAKYYTSRKYPYDENIMSFYPPCIKRLASQPKKGNYGRFLLTTFLLGVHTESDAKHALMMMLTESEQEHLKHGNCKDQFKTIVSRNYSPPSFKTMIDSGYVEETDDIPPSLTCLEFYGYDGQRK